MNLRLQYDRPPPLSLLAALRPKRTLSAGEALPDIEASCAPFVPMGLEPYTRLCGLPRDGTLPPTFPHVLGVPLQVAMSTHPQFPLNPMGIVHIRNSITQRRPIPEGQPVELRCRLTDQRLVRAGLEFDLRTELRFGGELAWESVSTGLTRSVKGNGGPRAEEPEPLRELQRSVAWPLPPQLGWRYAQATGDYNPIHLHPLTARPFGFKRPIMHGMWSLARGFAELDLPTHSPLRLDVEFFRPVFLPSSPVFSSGPLRDGRVEFELRTQGKLNVRGAITLG